MTVSALRTTDTGEPKAFNEVSGQISEPFDIRFEDVSCVASIRTPTKFWKPERKNILTRVNGEFSSGKLTGIVGPSGSGKSTLMDVIAGYRLKGVTGNVYINGRKNVQQMIRESCYIMQDSLLEPLVTVEEAMLFVANVKLSSKVSKKNQAILVLKILRNFEMNEHRHTLTENLSGGQKKKLAIALELISNPPILILDEPTSGLDSKSAKQCIQILRDLAFGGHTVICSIHQPSMSILDMFDSIYVLTGGKCIYRGTVSNIVPYLNANGLECPIYHNPLDFVMELCVLNPEETNVEQLVKAIDNGNSRKWCDGAVSIVQPSNTFNTKDRNFRFCNEEEEESRYATSFGHQFWCLLRRRLQIELRDPFLLRTRLLAHLIGGIVFGLLFFNIGNDGAKPMLIMNVSLISVMFTMYTALTSRIITFPQNLIIIRREHFNRWYSTRAFYLSSLFADIPVQVFSVVIFVLPLYYLSAMCLEVGRIMRVLLASVLLSVVYQDYGILMGILMNVQNGLIFGVFSTAPNFMFCGVFLYPRDTSEAFRWLYDVSALRHAVEAIVVAVFGYDREPLDCHQTICFYKYPKDFLKLVDIENHRYEHNLLFIGFFDLMLKFLCFVALKCRL